MKNKIYKVLLAAASTMAIIMCTATVTGKETTSTVINDNYVEIITVTSYCGTMDGLQLNTNDCNSYYLETENMQQDAKTQIYHVNTESDHNKLMDVLENRDGKIIIEVLNGTVINKNGDGVDICGYYIKYDMDNFRVGDKVQSVFVYNAESNAIDDILYRVDTLIQ